MKKKLLVDLSSLKRIYSGLGQIALTYGYYFRDHYDSRTSSYELTLLVPRAYVGAFGDEVKYLSSSGPISSRARLLFARYDGWHSIHQLSHFKPFHKRIKVILTIHDLNYLYEKEKRSRERYHRRIQRKINRATAIVCISNFTKREVESRLQLGQKEVKVVYNQVPTLDPRVALLPGFEVKSPFFFSLGVIKKKKNFHTLLDLMKLMPERHLYIVGDGAHDTENGYAQAMLRRIENERIANVSLLDPMSHAEKIWMYQHCEAFLFPSLLEGFGIPVIEALQFGKPVFVSKETSLKEIGNRYAFFWDDFDPQSMKKRVETGLAEFHGNGRLAEEAKEYASWFSTDRHFEEYEELYAII